MEAYFRTVMIVDAVERGWTVKKLSDSTFQFKKSLERYVQDRTNDDGIFGFFSQLLNQIE
jgi:hypothetical protein